MARADIADDAGFCFPSVFTLAAKVSMDQRSVQRILRKLMGKRAAIHGTFLRARPLEEKAAAVQRFAHEVVPHLATGRMRAIVDRVFPVEDAAAAFDYMAGSGKFGKVLLAF